MEKDIFNNVPRTEYQFWWAEIHPKGKTLSYAYGTEKGNICIKADKMIDAATLRRLLKNGGLSTP